MRTAHTLAQALALLLAAGAPGLALAREASQEQCKAMVRPQAGGDLTPVDFPALHLVGRAAASALPTPPDAIALVTCGRDSILPTVKDVRVLIDYRVPLSITDGERVAFLEVQNGQVHLRMADGALTPREMREVRSRLDQLQLAFNRSGQPQGR